MKCFPVHKCGILLLIALSHTLLITNSTAADSKTPADPTGKQAKQVDFARDVYPILRRACLECHGPEKQEGELRLDSRADAFKADVIKAGEPDDSELLRRVLLPRGHDELMPAIGNPLPKRQITTLREWIQQGADWPKEFEVVKHWAYVIPSRPELPAVSNSVWAKSPLDRFVLKKLDDEGLKPSPRATPEKRVRRAFLALIGLPPTPAEVQDFVKNPTDTRYEQLVDELLKRPQFGERWARPWLDLARYADSHGFQRDNLRDVWAYRDWVIRALNADMPFDQFTVEQIAGDLLPNATESQKVATGFQRCTPTNVEAGSLPEETRIEQVIDRVNTTGAVWLGTTLECCQCHDHKYDPFTQRDYYRLLAFYNNTQLEADRANPMTPSSIKFLGPSMPLSNQKQDAERKDLQSQIAKVKQQQTNRRKTLASTLETWAAGFSRQLGQTPRTQALEITKFESQGTTDTFKRLDDKSILLVGDDPPNTDVYKVHCRTELKQIRAFKVEALRHRDLPGMGPGRGDPVRRNFILSNFTADVRPIEASSVPAAKVSSSKLKFVKGIASFSQKKWDVGAAIDNDPKTGWAISPEFDKSHWATFILAEPLDVPDGHELVFTLTQKYGAARTIGCVRLSAVTGNPDGTSIDESIVKAARKPASKWSKAERKRLLDFRAKQDSATADLARQVAKLEQRIAALKSDTTLVMIELEKPRMASIFERGDYRKPGKPVSPGTPEILHSIPKGPASRITLAKWLASRDNPLVARVTVNRWWAELFGQGIVTTVEDFGIKGETPSHPELLDWLAVEFMDNGWSMKKLLKTIVLSSTFQQSSRITPELLEQDDLNRLLARGPRYRMDAEMIRDNALAISGLLSLQQFGPPIRPYQPPGIWSKVGGTSYKYEVSPGSEQYRRGVYVVIKRGSPYPSFITFDATARLACTVQRSRTNTPLQALTLLNDPVYVNAARSLAKRVTTDKADQPLDAQLTYAFQLCTARTPNANERRVLQSLYSNQQKAGKGKLDAWFNVASVLLNLHETITQD